MIPSPYSTRPALTLDGGFWGLRLQQESSAAPSSEAAAHIHREQQDGSLGSVPGLKPPTLSSSSQGSCRKGLLSLLKQMVTAAYFALGAVTGQAPICPQIRTSFATSGNGPLFGQKPRHQSLGAELADSLPCLILPGPTDKQRRFHQLVRRGQGLVGRAAGGPASSCPQALGEAEAVAPGIHRAVWRGLSWLRICPASLIRRNAGGRPGEKQVTKACLTKAEQAGKGANCSVWTLYRESYSLSEEATKTNPTSRGGFPMQMARQRTEWPSGVLKSLWPGGQG